MKYDIQEFQHIIKELQFANSSNIVYQNWPKIRFKQFLQYIMEEQIPLKNGHLLQIAISSNTPKLVQLILKKYNRYSANIIEYAFNCFLKNQSNHHSFQILQSLVTEADYTCFKEEDITQIINLLGHCLNTLNLLDVVFFHIQSEFHISLLMQYKTINCNLQDQRGRTALHYAVQNNCVSAVQALVSQPNININLQDCHGYTALDYGVYNHQTEIINILQNHQDNSDLSILLSKIKKYLLPIYNVLTASNSSPTSKPITQNSIF